MNANELIAELRKPQTVAEIVEEHARMKWHLHIISGWVSVAQNSGAIDTRFVVDQIQRSVAAVADKSDVKMACKDKRIILSDFEKCRASLYALDVLDAAGLLDSPAADALRDASDAPWLAISESEREMLRNEPPGGEECPPSK